MAVANGLPLGDPIPLNTRGAVCGKGWSCRRAGERVLSPMLQATNVTARGGWKRNSVRPVIYGAVAGTPGRRTTSLHRAAAAPSWPGTGICACRVPFAQCPSWRLA